MMKNNFLGLLMAATVAGAMFTGCNKETGKGEQDLGTYTPQATDDLRQLMVDANAKLRAERQMSVATTLTSTESERFETQTNANVRKRLSISYSKAASFTFTFTFIDNDKAYDKDVNRNDSMRLGRPSTNAEKYFTFYGNLIDLDHPDYTFSFSLNEAKDKIVVTHTTGSINVLNWDKAAWEVVLTADKRYKAVKGTSNVNGDMREYVFSYSAVTPALPGGYKPSDFTNKLDDYFATKVIWGNGLGEDTFWQEKNERLYLEGIARYAPDVAGKTISGFRIGSTDYGTSGPTPPLTDNSTVITAVWR